MTRFIVIRGAEGMDPLALRGMEGRWIEADFEISDVTYSDSLLPGSVTAYPTDRFEERGDGAQAEVYEVPRCPLLKTGTRCLLPTRHAGGCRVIPLRPESTFEFEVEFSDR